MLKPPDNVAGESRFRDEQSIQPDVGTPPRRRFSLERGRAIRDKVEREGTTISQLAKEFELSPHTIYSIIRCVRCATPSDQPILMKKRRMEYNVSQLKIFNRLGIKIPDVANKLGICESWAWKLIQRNVKVRMGEIGLDIMYKGRKYTTKYFDKNLLCLVDKDSKKTMFVTYSDLDGKVKI